jgi:hypothetical protein
MRDSDHFGPGARVFARSGIVAVLAASALAASVAVAGADVVPGTEDGWGAPPGGVTLSVVGDDGSGNHQLSVTWGSIDPAPANGGYWQCEVNERFTPTSNDTYPTSVSKAFFDVKLVPPSGGSFQRGVAGAPGQRITMSITCYTVYPGAFATTPPSPPFGWHFDYQLS